jgi:hypothetical protein
MEEIDEMKEMEEGREKNGVEKEGERGNGLEGKEREMNQTVENRTGKK